ncbi:unnamed protein product [Ixodes persulcatus]
MLRSCSETVVFSKVALCILLYCYRVASKLHLMRCHLPARLHCFSPIVPRVSLRNINPLRSYG